MKLKQVVLGLCTTLLIVLSSCAGSDERSFQKYLEERYNEQFTIMDSEASADDGSDIPDEYYVLGWDRNERELCTFYGSRLTSREDYIRRRTQAELDLDRVLQIQDIFDDMQQY